MTKNSLSRLALLVFVVANVTRAQSAAIKKDIPTIAQSAKSAIVTIVMANNDKPLSLGSGFLVSPEGVIVTNYHVIQSGNAGLVKFADHTIIPVDGVVAANKVRDIAIIKIHGKSFRTLTLGNSDRMQVGDKVVAIGNPGGLEQTVSDGLLSGVRTDSGAGGRFLQISVPITHGSSGGPLFNMMGEVIGITTEGLEGSGNLNFAIPINDAKRILLTQSGKLRGLPNEPPPVEAEQAEPTRPATLEQQKMCAEQAEQAFRKVYPNGRFAGAYASFTSHYDTARGICLVEMYTSRHAPDPTKKGIWIYTKRIDDAFGNQSYGFYQFYEWFTESGDAQKQGGACLISLVGHVIGQDDIECKSEDEFDALARKYFGIAP